MSLATEAHREATPRLQLCVLSFGLLQNGDVAIGVFPEVEEVFVGGECPDAGGICISTSTHMRSTGTSWSLRIK